MRACAVAGRRAAAPVERGVDRDGHCRLTNSHFFLSEIWRILETRKPLPTFPISTSSGTRRGRVRGPLFCHRRSRDSVQSSPVSKTYPRGVALLGQTCKGLPQHRSVPSASSEARVALPWRGRQLARAVAPGGCVGGTWRAWGRAAPAEVLRQPRPARAPGACNGNTWAMLGMRSGRRGRPRLPTASFKGSSSSPRACSSLSQRPSRREGRGLGQRLRTPSQLTLKSPTFFLATSLPARPRPSPLRLADHLHSCHGQLMARQCRARAGRRAQDPGAHDAPPGGGSQDGHEQQPCRVPRRGRSARSGERRAHRPRADPGRGDRGRRALPHLRCWPRDRHVAGWQRHPVSSHEPQQRLVHEERSLGRQC